MRHLHDSWSVHRVGAGRYTRNPQQFITAKEDGPNGAEMAWQECPEDGSGSTTVCETVLGLEASNVQVGLR